MFQPAFGGSDENTCLDDAPKTTSDRKPNAIDRRRRSIPPVAGSFRRGYVLRASFSVPLPQHPCAIDSIEDKVLLIWAHVPVTDAVDRKRKSDRQA